MRMMYGMPNPQRPTPSNLGLSMREWLDLQDALKPKPTAAALLRCAIGKP